MLPAGHSLRTPALILVNFFVYKALKVIFNIYLYFVVSGKGSDSRLYSDCIFFSFCCEKYLCVIRKITLESMFLFNELIKSVSFNFTHTFHSMCSYA